VIETIFGEGRELHAAQMAARAFVLFFITLALVRLAGMRSFGSKSAFDAIVVIMLGAVLARAVVGVSPFWSTVGAAAVLAVVHRLLAILVVKVPALDGIIKGSVAVLYQNGVVDDRAMLRFGVNRNDIDEAVRRQGLMELSEVRAIYKEADGTLSVISYSPTARRSQPERHAGPRA
jgi:uncharacterized membrane protein YcaP (DUF421 family)